MSRAHERTFAKNGAFFAKKPFHAKKFRYFSIFLKKDIDKTAKYE